MVHLMNLTHHNSRRPVTFAQNSPKYRVQGIFYDGQLVNMVHDCLKINPGDRPNAANLWAEIQAHVTTWDGLDELPMKAKGLEEGDEGLLRCLGRDEYALWTQ